MIQKLPHIEQAVAAVKIKPPKDRRAVIDKLLAGDIDYLTPEGKALGTRRALLCTRLAEEKLWPDR